MLFGFSGASGTGKSTLCDMVSEALSIPFRRTSITESAARHGFDAVGELSLSDRIRLQKCLLDDHIKMLDRAPRPLIVDRTPIDMVAYLLAEFDMHSGKKVEQKELEQVSDLVGAYIGATMRFYDMIFLLGPLPRYEVSATRPPLNPAYQLHTDLLMRGAMTAVEGRVNYAVINTPDLETRFNYATDVLEKRINAIDAMRSKARHVH